jgi:lipid II:glycine glycyltransferase (peptidoglycan interpeptide bridge formation enzyme)
LVQNRQTKYQELVEVSLANQNVSDNIDKLKSKRDVEEKVTKVSEVLKNSALECIPGKKEKEKTWQTTNLE